MRTAAAEAVVDFCEHAPLSKPAFMSEIMLPLKSLAADNNQSVRVALASRVLQLTSRCVHEDASTHVLDLILTLLKDKVRPRQPRASSSSPPFSLDQVCCIVTVRTSSRFILGRP